MDESPRDVDAVALVVVGGAEVAEAGGRIGEQVVGDDEDGVADGDRGALGAPSRGEAVELRPQIGLRPPCGMGGLQEGTSEPGAALPSTTTPVIDAVEHRG